MKTAIVLAGGKGTRLGEDMPPKAMLRVNGRTLLDRQLDYLRDFGYTHVILCLGYRSDEVDHGVYEGMEVLACFEEDFLGTGGAVRHAVMSFPDICAGGVHVLNVDDLARVDISEGGLSRSFVVCQPLPYSVWVDDVMFSQNEAMRHVGHTWLVARDFVRLPRKGSLESCIALRSKEGEVGVLCFEGDWFTVNSVEQLRDVESRLV